MRLVCWSLGSRSTSAAGRAWFARPTTSVVVTPERVFVIRVRGGHAEPPAAARPAGELRRGDVPFDLYTGEFSHQGPRCTYDVMVQRFGLTASPAVERIGRIVHDLDMHDTRDGCKEAPAVSRMVEGLRQFHVDDHALLQHGVEMFEALARGILAE
jgi:hypothetical protein